MRTIGNRIGSVAASRLATPREPHPIYWSREMRRWRKEVIARAEGRCQGCGATGIRLWADHIVEIRDGGAPFDLRNGQALCPSCHTKKTMQKRSERVRNAF